MDGYSKELVAYEGFPSAVIWFMLFVWEQASKLKSGERIGVALLDAARRRPRVLWAEESEEGVENPSLTLCDFARSVSNIEPFRAVRLWEIFETSRLRRPLHSEFIAFKGSQIEISLEGPYA